MDRRQRRGLIFCLLAIGLTGAQAQTPQPTPPATATPSVSTPVKPWSKPSPLDEAPKPPGPPPAFPPGDLGMHRPADHKPRRPEFERKGEDERPLADKLPPGVNPEEFRQNLNRWKQMTPEQRQALRGQIGDRGERIKAETDAALNQTGLQLTPDQMEVFALRYMQERRKLEHALLEQMNVERSRRLPHIIDQLKKEFQPTPTPPPTVKTPAPSPSSSPSANTQ